MGYKLQKAIPLEEISGLGSNIQTFAPITSAKPYQVWIPSFSGDAYLVDLKNKSVLRTIHPTDHFPESKSTWGFTVEGDKLAMLLSSGSNSEYQCVLMDSENTELRSSKSQVFSAQYLNGVLYVNTGHGIFAYSDILEAEKKGTEPQPVLSELNRKAVVTPEGFVTLTQCYDPDTSTGRVIIYNKDSTKLEELSVGRHNSSLAVRNNEIFVGFPYGIKVLTPNPLETIDEVDFDSNLGVLLSIAAFPNSNAIAGLTLDNLLLFEQK